MPRITALVYIAAFLTACASRSSPNIPGAYFPGVYASVDYSIDRPNPILPGRPRYAYFSSGRRLVVYYPVRGKLRNAPRAGTSLLWASQTWSIIRIWDRSSGPDDKQCCHYGAFMGRSSKGVFWLLRRSYGHLLAWFPPKSRERHDYFRVRRSLPRPGSPYSFVPHLLRFKV